MPLALLPLLVEIGSGPAVADEAFALSVYKTGEYAACLEFYGEVGVIDNFCEGNGHVG